MDEKQRVTDMAGVADEAAATLTHDQAWARTEQTGETFEGALKAILETEAAWKAVVQRERRELKLEQRERELRKERSRAQREERSRAQLAAWNEFTQAERRELELRKDGQLGRLLGEALPGEPPAALQRLASEDRRQAEEGLVALMSNGEVFYKHLEELSEGDLPARRAANSLRTTWLKERKEDKWCGCG